MAVKEHAFGPLYAAKVESQLDRCPVHTAEMTEMHPPWRRGKVLLLPWRRYQALAVGVWWPVRGQGTDPAVRDELWLNPKILSTTPQELGKWGQDAEEEEAED